MCARVRRVCMGSVCVVSYCFVTMVVCIVVRLVSEFALMFVEPGSTFVYC